MEEKETDSEELSQRFPRTKIPELVVQPFHFCQSVPHVVAHLTLIVQAVIGRIHHGSEGPFGRMRWHAKSTQLF